MRRNRPVGLGRTLNNTNQIATINMRSQRRNQIEGVVALHAIALEDDPARAGWQQSARREYAEIRSILIAQSHLGEHTDTESRAHIGFDQVSIARGHRKFQFTTGLDEGASQRRFRGQRGFIADQRMLGELVDTWRAAKLGQRMPLWHEDLPIPAEDRNRQIGIRRGAGGADDRKIGNSLAQQLNQFGIAMRFEAYADIRKMPLHLRYRIGKDKTRLSVRGDNNQLATVVAAQIRRHHTDIRRLGENHPGPCDDLRACRGHRIETLAFTQKKLETQLILQLAQLPRNTRLSGMHALGGQRYVEAGIGDGDDIAQLGQGHGVEFNGFPQ